MPVFTSWISWGLRCQALGKPKMPHHNVTPQPQWQTTNPRDTQLNDLSHLVRGEHCLPNNQGMTWVWGAGHLLRSISFEMPRLTANGLYTANGAKFTRRGANLMTWGPCHLLWNLWRGNACVGVSREVRAILTYMSHQWYTTLEWNPKLWNTKMCVAVTVGEVGVKDVMVLKVVSVPPLMWIISSRALHCRLQRSACLWQAAAAADWSFRLSSSSAM